jgi:rod shape-determining protein MreC
MRSLILFIFKHHFFFLFLIFEVFSITLFVQNNYYPQQRYFSITNEIAGFVHKTNNNITRYLSLTRVNKELAEDNAALINHTLKSFIKTDTSTYLIRDTVYKQVYKYTAARVINNSVNKRNNYLTLNKGKNEGIDRDMAVITKNGVVGIVKNVSWHFASVISILNSKSKISAKIKKNNYVGSVMWEGMNYRMGLLRDVPSHAVINKGDTVVTSGYSNIFPEGIPIGTIVFYKKEKGESFYTIYIKFTNDFDKLGYVYVVKNFMKEEQNKLEKATQNE